MQGVFLTTSESAKILDLSPDRVRQLERAGELAALKTAGGQRLFKRNDVERLAQKRAVRKGTSRACVEVGDAN